MARTRMTGPVAIAVVLVLALAGAPVSVGAAPARVKAPRTGIAATAVSATADDDNIASATVLPLPASVTDSLDATSDIAPIDTDDVYRVYLDKGDRLVATLTVEASAVVGIWVFGPGATDLWVDDILAESDENNVVSYYAPVTGYYCVDVWASAPMPADPDGGFEAYLGWAGPYTLDVAAIPPSPTTITVKTTATSARTGSIPILSGAVTPIGMIGKNIVVYVKKPGKAYWTYSSNRTVYNKGGLAAWQYKYYFKPGMVKGYYVFMAHVPAWPGFLTSTSPITVTIRLR